MPRRTIRGMPQHPQVPEQAFAPRSDSLLAGVGVDVVDLELLAARLARVPRLRERLFAPEERHLSLSSLAARAAAKEAVGKALGNPGDLSWHDVIVRSDDSGRPYLVLRGQSLRTAQRLGVTHLHVSLSHDGPLATAMVVAERGRVSR